MTRSPFIALNTAAIRAERRENLAQAGHTLIAALVGLAVVALVLATFHTALALPEIVARSAAQAAW